MKPFFQLAFAAAIFSGLAVTSYAQTVCVSDDFESYTPGAFNSSVTGADASAVAAADTKTVSAAILDGKDSPSKSKALQIDASLVSGGFNVAGIAWNPAKQPNGKNTDKELAHYTLSFDIAVTSGASFAADGLVLDVNILGQQSNTGISVSPDVTAVKAKGGSKHVTITLESNKKFLDRPTLDPTDQNIRFEFNLVGPVPSATEEKVVIDNVQISVDQH